eukprot:TRINITY_DN6857_c0_g1_i3.p1 TRINITY_DN6857_c0_g1~~TRINITY_DN6857_c0_g1_i3.p1  ORF type:complete len:427 (-),score=24.49 TRINITY_DN6857_c0_g1_i3:61-1341(-)
MTLWMISVVNFFVHTLLLHVLTKGYRSQNEDSSSLSTTIESEGNTPSRSYESTRSTLSTASTATGTRTRSRDSSSRFHSTRSDLSTAIESGDRKRSRSSGGDLSFQSMRSNISTEAEVGDVRVPKEMDSRGDPTTQCVDSFRPKKKIQAGCWGPGATPVYAQLPVQIETYTLTKLLGSGFEGEVYKGKTQDGHDVAMKLMDLEIGSKEAHVMRCLQRQKSKGHRNILNIKDDFDIERKAFVVTEFADGGDYFDYEKRVVLSPEIKLALSGDLIEGLNHCHEHGVFHGDIKLDNLFVKRGVLKIGDFGMSRMIGKQGRFKASQCGTPEYWSPEITEGQDHRFEPDVWAAVSRAFGWNKIREWDLKELLLGMLETNQTERWTMKKVMESAFFKRSLEQRKAKTTGAIRIGGEWTDSLLRRIGGLCCMT